MPQDNELDKSSAKDQPNEHWAFRKFLRYFLGGLFKFLYRPRYEGLADVCRFLFAAESPEEREKLIKHVFNSKGQPRLRAMTALSEKNFAKPGCLLCGNHRSVLDVVAIHPVLPVHITWLAKKELFDDIFLVSSGIEKMGAVSVDRSKVDITSMKKSLKVLREGGTMGLFPQATRLSDEEALRTPAKTGSVQMAVKTSAVMIPFCICKPYKLFHKNKIVFGRPYCFNNYDGRRLSNESAESMGDLMMKSIFEPAGMSFEAERTAEASAVSSADREQSADSK